MPYTYQKPTDTGLYDIDDALELLTSSLPDLKQRWDKYICTGYTDYHLERMVFVDIFELSVFLVERYAKGDTGDFHMLFDTLEMILGNCTTVTENLLVFGLINDIQRGCKLNGFNCWTGFDKWLGPVTKRKWDYLLSF